MSDLSGCDGREPTGLSSAEVPKVRCLDPHCGSENPRGQRFCGKCGKPLDPDLLQLVEWAVSRKLEAEFKDKKVVEIETAEAIASRLIAWGKTYATFFGVTLAVLAVAFGVMGLSSYSDFKKKVEDTKASLDTSAKTVQDHYDAQVKKIKTEGEKVTKQFRKDQAVLAAVEKSLPELRKKIASLQDEIDANENQFNGKFGELKDQLDSFEEMYGKASPIPPEAKARIEAVYGPYRQYLATLGLKGTEPAIRIVTFQDGRLNVSYLPHKRAIYADVRLAAYPELILGQSTHAVLAASHILESNRNFWALDGMPSDLEHGLCDYFVCSFLDKSTIGEGYVLEAKKAGEKETDNAWLRNCDNDKKLSELTKDMEVHQAGEIFAGVMWGLRKRLTRAVSDPLIAGAWMAMTRDDVDEPIMAFATRFRDLLLEQDRTRNNGKNVEVIQAVFEERGLKP